MFISFFYANRVNKQNGPRWDFAFCGVTSGAILFVIVPKKKKTRLIRVKLQHFALYVQALRRAVYHKHIFFIL